MCLHRVKRGVGRRWFGAPRSESCWLWVTVMTAVSCNTERGLPRFHALSRAATLTSLLLQLSDTSLVKSGPMNQEAATPNGRLTLTDESSQPPQEAWQPLAEIHLARTWEQVTLIDTSNTEQQQPERRRGFYFFSSKLHLVDVTVVSWDAIWWKEANR